MTASRGFTSCVHFGEILERLRTQAGFSQSQLAAAAGMSLSSVQRGETSPTCPYRPRSSLAIFNALRAKMVITEDQRQQWGAATNTLALLPAVAGDLAEVIDAQDKVRTAHFWLDAILREMDADQVLTALQGIAAAWGVPLTQRSPPLNSVRFAKIQQQIDQQPPASPLPAVKLSTITEGVPVDEYHPTNPPPSPPPQAQPHRKTAP